MSTKLGKLRSELQRLHRTRRTIRLTDGACLLATAGILILLVAFLADWQLRMTVAQRVVLLGLVVVAGVWAYRRFARPVWQQKDDLVDLALAVERQHGIDSELVSALQFEQPEASQWGSVALETAVISRVAEMSPRLNVFDGLPTEAIKRHGMAAAALIVAVSITSALCPGYLGTFLSRLLALSSAQYPTDTHLALIKVSGQNVFESRHAGDSRVLEPVVYTPFGHPVSFEVHADGLLPVSMTGSIQIESLDRRIATEVALVASSDGPTGPTAGALSSSDAVEAVDAAKHDDAAGESQDSDATASNRSAAPSKITTTVERTESGSVIFRGDLPRLMDSVTFIVRLGDAQSPPLRIDAIPLPTVDLQLNVTPPAYAADRITAESADNAASQRQLSVLEGSRVDVSVRSLGRPLQTVELWIEEASYKLTPTKDDPLVWTLDAMGSPLESVSQALRYRVEVTDERGLQPESPLHGSIRLRSDQAPRAAIAVRTRKIIPAAQPPIMWSASDDFGLSRVMAKVQVTREDGTVEEHDRTVPIGPGSDAASSSRAGSAQPAQQPAPTSLSGEYRLDLSEFQLVKGDEVRVTFVAHDTRGDAESQTGFSEPVVFQVTDRQGILSGLLETDEESARQLDAIIRRELGIGESK